MPRTLKRRSDAISRDESESENPGPSRRQTQPQAQQSRRRESTPPSAVSEDDDDEENNGNNSGSDASNSPVVNKQAQIRTLSKKLVRLALSAEYARQPVRRADVNAKIMKDASSSGSRIQFRAIFNDAQQTLKNVFGMELVDLPSREKTGINERRKAASQKATQKDTQKESQSASQRAKDPLAAAQNWILVNRLPEPYRVHPTLFVPSRAPDEPTESSYIALYTLIVSILYLHTPSAPEKPTQDGAQPEDTTEPISEAKFMRYLFRLGLGEWTPMGGANGTSVDKLLARMLREGYLEKRKDTTGGEGIVEWVVGPRGKREIGRKGVAGLVRGVYGFGVDGRGKGLEIPGQDRDNDDEEEIEDQAERPARGGRVKMEKEELERRLKRTLGDVVTLKINGQGTTNGVEGEDEEMTG